MGDFRAPENHIDEEQKMLVRNLFEERNTQSNLKEELTRKQNFTKSILCPGPSTSRGGLSTLKDFTAILERQFERSELLKAGLTVAEQDLYFQFRENSLLPPESQSFKDKLSVINEKIEHYFRDDDYGGKFKRPIDDINEIEKEMFDELDDVPSLKKRRKMMMKEEKKLERIISTPVGSQDKPNIAARSSKSKWDQR